MSKHAFAAAAFLACASLLASAGVLLAQAAPTDVDFDRQQPSQSQGVPASSDPDGLLRDLFSDPATPTQSSGPPPVAPVPPPASVQTLPGIPSPVTTPARPGEAVVERAQPAPAQAAPAQAAQPVRRRAAARKPVWYTSPRVQDVHGRAIKAWIPKAPRPSCPSLVGGRELYHIRCVTTARVGKPAAPYRENPAIYKIWP
ncbi:MAG: hypothetical protein LBG06_00785 [Deltaproteobacteria bacterium]|jgi:hypothetical protein|nr:hypothetical protein [Deltaproteobacteria bacterium]